MIETGSKCLTESFFLENTVSVVWELLKDCFTDNISTLKKREFYFMQYYNQFKIKIQNSDDLVQKVLKYVILVLKSEESTLENDLSLSRTNGNAAVFIGAMLKKHSNNLFLKSFLELVVGNFNETSSFYISLNQLLLGISFRITYGKDLFVCCVDKTTNREILWNDIINSARKYHLETFLESRKNISSITNNSFVEDLSFVERVFEDFLSCFSDIRDNFYSKQPFTVQDNFTASLEVFLSIFYLSLPSNPNVSNSKFIHLISMHSGKIPFYRFCYGVMAKYFLRKINSVPLNKFLSNSFSAREATQGRQAVWTTSRILYFSGLFDSVKDTEEVIKLPLLSSVRVDLISRYRRNNKPTIGRYQLNTFR